METGIADDAALLNEPSDAKAAAAVSAWAALGIDDVRIFVQWQAIAPANSEVKAPDGFNSADPDSPGYNWSRVDRAVSLVGAAGMRPLLVVTGPAPLWASQVPAPPQPALQAATRPLRPVRARGGAALRRGRRPLDHLERAQPAAVAAAAEHVRGQALHAGTPRTSTAGSCAPPTRRSRRWTPTSTVLFGALAPRGENAHEAERAHDAAGLHPFDGVRQGPPSSAIAPGRARAFSRSAATDSPTTPMPRRARPMSRSRVSTRRRSPTCRAWSARSTAPSARVA